MKNKLTQNVSTPNITKVFFLIHAIIDNEYIEVLSNDKYSIDLNQQFIILVNRNTKTKFWVPLSNVRSLAIE